ncbi:MAG: hypothetical protein QM779_06265 [Propionicimonas sp.]|uniref:hypothetical protein n=1 Tax=Propionicimonas sp. TaxID=1955623 RepID=UPI003D148A18
MATTASTLRTRRTPSLHLVPEGGVLLFPGVPQGLPAPVQLGPMMTPPGREALFGR